MLHLSPPPERHAPTLGQPDDLGSAEVPVTWYSGKGKRLFDLAVSLLLLVMVSPFALLLALTVRLVHGSGVLFRQERIGLDGKTFVCLKFRTMAHDRRSGDRLAFAGTDRRQQHKCQSDPRHTPFGRFMRRYSLDELPQLLNVLRGEMSLVGPRPEVASIASADFVEHPRHRCRPGITGPFQLSDLRIDGALRPGLPLDEQYVSRISFGGDIRLLALTGLLLIRGSGN